MAQHVYHWKHGWIPLTHEAALSKAKGNKSLAAKYVSDAHSPEAGIKSRQHVAHAVRDLPNVPSDSRDHARSQVAKAAAEHNSTDLLPSHMRGGHLTSVPDVADKNPDEVKAGDVIHVPGLGGKTRRYKIDKAFDPKGDGTVNIDATNLETGKKQELSLMAFRKVKVEKKKR